MSNGLTPEELSPETSALGVAAAAEPWLCTDDQAMNTGLYDPALTYKTALTDIETAALDSLCTPDEAKATATEWTPRFARYGMSDAESRAVADAVGSTLRKAPDEATRTAWADESRKALRDEFGDRAGVVLNATKAMIASDARLKAHLNSTGLGSHPRVTKALAAAADRFMRQGKLKG